MVVASMEDWERPRLRRSAAHSRQCLVRHPKHRAVWAGSTAPQRPPICYPSASSARIVSLMQAVATPASDCTVAIHSAFALLTFWMATSDAVGRHVRLCQTIKRSQHMIGTHAFDLAGKMTIEQMQEAARLGAFIEFDFRNTLEGGRTDAIRKLGPQFSFISEFWTKLSSPRVYGGPEGVGAFADAMRSRGFTDRELEVMFKENPAKALGLKAVP